MFIMVICVLNSVMGRNLVLALTEPITVAVRSPSGEFDGRIQEGSIYF